MNKLIIISGPTASGKTKTSIEVAQHIRQLQLKVEIVNFDSLLFYKELSIGTAKPTPEERQGIPHHMVDIESIRSPMNAAQFIAQGEAIIKKLMAVNKIVILVGGSAFYLRALLKGMYESLTVPKDLKIQMTEEYKKEGIKPFLEYLQKHDPESLKNYHENDHYRLTRAVEHHRTTGQKISEQKKSMDLQNPYDFSVTAYPWEILHLYLDLPKDEHFKIISQRTAQMFKDGFLEEIENLLTQGFDPGLKPLQSIGYKEVLDYKNGLYDSLDSCMERMSISTRQLAKSQRTFFNKITPKETFNPLTDLDRIKQKVTDFLKNQDN